MANNTAVTQTTNLVPVQGIFEPEPTFALVNLIGPAGTVFYPNMNPIQSGLTITDSTIDSTVIGANAPAAGYFTSIYAVTGQVATTPSADTDIANKAYVDSVAQGLDIKASCLYTTTNNITLSGLATQAGGDWTSSLTAGDRILVKNQTNSANNGIYAASASGWTRTADMNTWSEVPGAFTFIEDGATLASTGWVTTAGHTGTIGVTAMPWTQFSGAGTYSAGNGLQLISNVFSVVANGTSIDVSSSGIKISSTWPGQTSITTLGTIATGEWAATDIAVLHGGTGASDAATARTNLGAAASGANSDITSLSGLTGGISTPTFIQMGNGNAVTLAAGKMWYTPSTGAWNLGMGNGNITQQVGEELFVYGKASATISGETILQLIRKTGVVGASGVITFGPTIAGMTDANAIIGVATEDIATGSFGRITSFGVVNGINTNGSTYGETWVDGDEIWYNPTTGGLTKTKPVAPNMKFQVGTVINAGPGGSGSFQVHLQPGSVLGGTDSNVQFGTLSNGDLMQYQDGALGYWTNVAPSTVSVGYATTAGSAGSSTTAVTSTNLAGGLAGSVPYQSGAGATTFLAIGTTNYVMTAGASAPQWVAQSTLSVGSATTATSAGKATNLAGGAAASIPYQSAADTTAFLASSAGDSGKVLTSQGTSAPIWTTPTAYATVTDDTTSGTTFYPLIANVTTGNLTTEYVSSTKLQFVPSTGILTATGFSGSGASLTNLPAGNLSGTIPSAVLGNSSLYIGTTSIALNRGSAIQSLTGVSIDGSAGSAGSATNATNAANIAITDDTSTNADEYLVWVKNTTGNLPAYVSSTKLKFNPSTGVFTATGGTGGGNF